MPLDDDLRAILGSSEEDQLRAGQQRLARFLAHFRDDLLASGFDRHEAAELVRDYAGVVLQAELRRMRG